MIQQLNPIILVNTPSGTGQALFVIDYGPGKNSVWVVALEPSGTIKHFDSSEITVTTDFTARD